jgi:phosphoglycolate phosphatase
LALECVLFDFDFTLADPSPWLIPAWREALGAIEAPPPDAAGLRTVVGRPLQAQYAAIVREPPSGPRFEIFESTYREYRDQHAGNETVLFPGAHAAIQALDRAGLVLGIVSTGAPERLRAILSQTGLAPHFRVVHGAAAEKAPVIVSVAGTLGLPLPATVYVGDHPTDCQAAVAAGSPFIAVETGVHTAQDFPPGTTVVSSIADLPGLLLVA